jgi:hypothetical protein
MKTYFVRIITTALASLALVVGFTAASPANAHGHERTCEPNHGTAYTSNHRPLRVYKADNYYTKWWKWYAYDFQRNFGKMEAIAVYSNGARIRTLYLQSSYESGTVYDNWRPLANRSFGGKWSSYGFMSNYNAYCNTPYF